MRVPDPNPLGDLLREIRVHRRLTQADVATRSGLSSQTIHRMESTHTHSTPPATMERAIRSLHQVSRLTADELDGLYHHLGVYAQVVLAAVDPRGWAARLGLPTRPIDRSMPSDMAMDRFADLIAVTSPERARVLVESIMAMICSTDEPEPGARASAARPISVTVSGPSPDQRVTVYAPAAPPRPQRPRAKGLSSLPSRARKIPARRPG